MGVCCGCCRSGLLGEKEGFKWEESERKREWNKRKKVCFVFLGCFGWEVEESVNENYSVEGL